MDDQKADAIHDGELVRMRLSESGISPVDFNRRMNWTTKRIYKMLKKADWETGELLQAGKVLRRNFFETYTRNDVFSVRLRLQRKEGAVFITAPSFSSE